MSSRVSLWDSRLNDLYQVRGWLMRLLFTEAWVFATLAGLTSWSSLTALDGLLMAVGAALIVAGWVLRHHTIGLWLIVGAPLTLVVAAALGAPAGSARWIALAVSIGHVTYGLVLLTSRRLGLAVTVIATALLALIWSRDPQNVVPGALAVAGGWIAVASLAVSGIALWFAWHALVRQAEVDDARIARLADRARAEVETQENSRRWRATVTAIHTGVLAALDYVLRHDPLDPTQFQHFLREHPLSPTSPDSNAPEVRQATAARIAAGIVTMDSSVFELPLSADGHVAVRTAVSECALDAATNRGASELRVTATEVGDRCLIRIADNGTAADDHLGESPRDAILTESLGSVGGSWELNRVEGNTVLTMDLPADAHVPMSGAVGDGFDQGRVLIGTPLMAIGAVGLSFALIVGLSAARGWPLIVDAVLAIAAAIIIFVRRGRAPLLASTLTLVALAAIPWLMAVSAPTPDTAAALAAGVTTAGYALIAVALKARIWQGVAGLLLWAAGTLALARIESATEQQAIVIALVNCLVIVPVVVIVAAVGTRQYRLAQMALTVERDAVTRETIRANTATMIDQHLEACVIEAEAIVRVIARGEPFGYGMRHRVACLDGVIRATVQVDPVESGEFVRLAARLANAGFRRSIPATVHLLQSSGDRAPVDPSLASMLEAAIRDHSRFSLRTFSDGVEDHLVMGLDGPGDDAARALAELEASIFDNVNVTVSPDPAAETVVLVSRSIA